ncbi:MAG TPA: hypothetical protein VMC83_17825 [Streptosporangiaceae bacterium]|nr:hypothetical protein [Streptosporangiaceae bacterium]
MSEFLQAAFGLHTVGVNGVDADVFDLPDGASFAVADVGGMGSERSIGFLVEGSMRPPAVSGRSASRSMRRSQRTNGGATCTFVRQMATCTS